MTMPDPAAPRKPRRFWLFAPYVLALVAFGAWSAYWALGKSRLEAALDQAIKPGGAYGFSYADRRVGGYPFRYEVDFDQPRLSERSGWALAAPALEVEASALAPDHFVVVAPRGLTVTRPGKGAVDIAGQVLRASFGGWNSRPRFAIEARGVTLKPADGGEPTPFAAADAFQVNLRPIGDDKAQLLFALNGALASPNTLMSHVTDGKSNLKLEATLTHASALHGRDWPTLLQGWTKAGGEMDIVGAQAEVGGATLTADPSGLGLDDEGRLHGRLALRLTQGPTAMMALGGAGVLPPDTAAVASGLAPKEAKVVMKFRGGQTEVANIPIGKAPKLY